MPAKMWMELIAYGNLGFSEANASAGCIRAPVQGAAKVLIHDFRWALAEYGTPEDPNILRVWSRCYKGLGVMRSGQWGHKFVLDKFFSRCKNWNFRTPSIFPRLWGTALHKLELRAYQTDVFIIAHSQKHQQMPLVLLDCPYVIQELSLKRKWPTKRVPIFLV